MFQHQHHLEHLLRPEHYTSAEFYRTELRHLFRPVWHPVGVVGQLARPGDFLSFELLETPVLVRNMDGRLRAFLNVCPHRHSQLTDRPCGNTEKLRCRYHGWEFNAEGRTGKIPDAKAFRPWDRDNSCLTPFRVETCGEVVFVSLDPAALPLREFVGPYWDLWTTSFGGDFRFAAAWEQEFPCNWKVVLENSLESYHIPEVHPKTFKDYMPEENAWHELDARYSTFRTVPPRDFPARAEGWTVRRLGGSPAGEYWHRVLHPHLTNAALDGVRLLQSVYPTGPTTCRYRTLAFTFRGRRRTPLAWLLARNLRLIATHVARKVFAEDGAIYAGVQKGLAASPHRGVIGTREERIHVFQRYVLDKCRGPRELPLAAAGLVPSPLEGKG